MLFNKKKPIEEAPAPVVTEPPGPREWGKEEREITAGYVIKAFKIWNLNRPEHTIPEKELQHLLMGLRMTTGTTPEDALKAYEDYNNKKEGI